MNANAKETRRLAAPIWVALTAFAMVVTVFVADWITPAIISVGLAYQAPVVFAGLKGTRSLTIQVIMLGVVGLALGWFMDLAADSFHFSSDRIENRLLSVVSLAVVGSLTLLIPRNAKRTASP